MPRPKKRRVVACCPDNVVFGPRRCCFEVMKVLSIDAFEALRLIDYENMTQEEAASSMNVARTTVQRLYKDARQLLAQSLIEGFMIRVDGGPVSLKKNPIKCGKENTRMKVIVPIKNSSIAKQYQEAEAFILYTIEKDTVARKDTVIPEANEKAMCRRFMMSLGVDAIITEAMSEHAYKKYLDSGIIVYYGVDDPEKAIEAYLSKTLESMAQHITKDETYECCEESSNEACCQEDDDCCEETSVNHSCCGKH